MDSVNIYEAKTRLSQLVDKAVSIVQSLGGSIATIDEARAMLGIARVGASNTDSRSQHRIHATQPRTIR